MSTFDNVPLKYCLDLNLDHQSGIASLSLCQYMWVNVCEYSHALLVVFFSFVFWSMVTERRHHFSFFFHEWIHVHAFVFKALSIFLISIWMPMNEVIHIVAYNPQSTDPVCCVTSVISYSSKTPYWLSVAF